MIMEKAGRVASTLWLGSGICKALGLLAKFCFLDLCGGYMGNHSVMNYSTNTLCSILIQNSICLATVGDTFSDWLFGFIPDYNYSIAECKKVDLGVNQNWMQILTSPLTRRGKLAKLFHLSEFHSLFSLN